MCLEELGALLEIISTAKPSAGFEDLPWRYLGESTENTLAANPGISSCC